MISGVWPSRFKRSSGSVLEGRRGASSSRRVIFLTDISSKISRAGMKPLSAKKLFLKKAAASEGDERRE